MSWGYHLILDCKGCNGAVSDGDLLKQFAKNLVKEIDMVAYGEPVVEHFAKHDPTKAGFTLVQLIETSSITGHFVDSNRDAYLDIFSCKPVPIEKTIEFVNKWFTPEELKVHFLTRDAR